jgi:cytochrome c5
MVLVLATVLSACGSGSSQATTVPASGTSAADGAALLEARCSTCHSADKVKDLKQSQAAWDETVSKMMAKGAQLSDVEKGVLVEYLAKTYGP